MNVKEIQKLRKKFIAISMLSVFLVMLFIGSVINIVSYYVARNAIENTINNIAENDGKSMEKRRPEEFSSMPSFSEAFSPNFHYNRFYVIKYNENYEFIEILNNNNNNADESEEAKTVAEAVKSNNDSFGRHGVYYYRKDIESDGTIKITLLDCTAELSTIIRLLVATIATCAAALLITFVLVITLSGKAIRPEIENSARQKQFITNASHELKTPLAVIRANTELVELTYGENEWTTSTLKQVDHMNGLIQNLVMITKAEEREDKSKLSEINASEAVEQTVKPYEAVAVQSGKKINKQINANVMVTADESKIRQLTTILIDNAIKYCDENGIITVALSQQKKGLKLTVSNSYKEGGNVDYGRFFDRFYREDKSHNIDKGGYGIGLSIAESICKQYKGSIKVSWKDGIIYFVCQLS